MAGNTRGVIHEGHRFNSRENTMDAGIQNSGWRSRNRLARRYAGRNIAQAVQEICDYLALKMIDLHPGEHATTEQINRYALNNYCVAARALDPSMGAIGLNRQDDFQTLVLYWWAAHDDSITASPEAGRAPAQAELDAAREVRIQAFVEALVESQRKILEGNRDIVNGEVIDSIACQTGVFNKFAEKFTFLHPDVTSMDINERAYELLRGFLGEHLLRVGVGYAQLPTAEHGVEFTPDVKQNLKAKVVRVLGELADYNVIASLDRKLEAIEYIGFMKEVPQRDYLGRPVVVNGEYENARIPMSEQEINALIADANTAYAAAERLPIARVTEANLGPRYLNDDQISQIKQIIQDTLPHQDNVSSRDHEGIYRSFDGLSSYYTGNRGREILGSSPNAFIPLWSVFSQQDWPVLPPVHEDLGQAGNDQRRAERLASRGMRG